MLFDGQDIHSFLACYELKLETYRFHKNASIAYQGYQRSCWTLPEVGSLGGLLNSESGGRFLETRRRVTVFVPSECQVFGQVFPGRYMISKIKIYRNPNNLACCQLWIFNFIKYFRFRWSDRTCIMFSSETDINSDFYSSKVRSMAMSSLS